MTAKKTTNGHTKHNGHVSLAREEYDAFVAREESYTDALAEKAKAVNRTYDLTVVCNAQATRMTEAALAIQHLERISAMQGAFIDLLRADNPAIANLVDLSEFWRQWIIHTTKLIDARKTTHAEVDKIEPDLFRSWSHWVRDASKADRTFIHAGSRAEREAALPKTQGEMQEHIIRRQREENAKLHAKLQALEAEVEQYKNQAQAKQPAKDNQPQEEKRP